MNVQVESVEHVTLPPLAARDVLDSGYVKRKV